MHALAQDLRFALRYLARRRAFTAAAVLTLAVGIGAMTAIFSVVESVVLRPLPVAAPQRVMCVFERFKDQDSNVSTANFLDLRAATTAFAALAAVQSTSLNLTGGAAPERIVAGQGTRDLFTLFGARPAVGRLFTADEEVPGRDDVVLLGHGLWVRTFGADPQVVGRVLHLSGRPYRVVGVLRDGFDPLLGGEQLWLPLSFTAAARAQHDEHHLTVVGRLAPGISRAQAQLRLRAAMDHLAELYPEADGGRGVSLRPLAEVLLGDYRRRLMMLLAAVTLVLLLACCNVVNLLLVQGAARSKEMAVRMAVGGGRLRVVRQLLTESAVLALLAALTGTVLARLGLGALLAGAPAGIPHLGETRIDGGVLAFTVAVALASSLVFGLVPALRAARGGQGVLRTGDRGGGQIRDRLRSILVLVEVAVSLTLLAGAGLLIRGARHLQSVPLGFTPRGAVAAQVALPESAYPNVERFTGAFRQMLVRLAHSPGVAAAAVVSRAPLGPPAGTNGLLPQGQAPLPQNWISGTLRIVSDDYFTALRIPLRSGRLFDSRDTAGGQKVMLLSRELARRVFPAVRDPVGRQVACCDGTPDAPRWRTVIGVVDDVRSDGPAAPVVPELYLPLDQTPAPALAWLQRSMTLVARASTPEVGADAIRQAVTAVDPALPVYGLGELAGSVRAATAETRFQMLILSLLGGIGLLLAMVGIYSVVAYLISLRRYEIAIRTALGAAPRDILWLLAWQGLRPILAGLAAGGGVAVAAARTLAASLPGVSVSDPLSFAGAALLLFAVGLAATLVPAGRATRAEPVRALRAT